MKLMKNFIEVIMKYDDAAPFAKAGLVQHCLVHVPIPGNELEVGPPKPEHLEPTPGDLFEPGLNAKHTTIRRLQTELPRSEEADIISAAKKEPTHTHQRKKAKSRRKTHSCIQNRQLMHLNHWPKTIPQEGASKAFWELVYNKFWAEDESNKVPMGEIRQFCRDLELDTAYSSQLHYYYGLIVKAP